MTPITISAQIKTGKNLVITHSHLSLQTLIDIDGDITQINTESVLSKYRERLKTYVEKYSFTGMDAVKYQYQPTKLCYDIYGTIELTPMILQLNHMTSCTQFCNLDKGIYLYDANIIDFINEVMLKEQRDLQRNRSEVEAELMQVG